MALNICTLLCWCQDILICTAEQSHFPCIWGCFALPTSQAAYFMTLFFYFIFFFISYLLIQYGFNSGCAFIVYKPGFLYDCYLFYMDVSCTLWFCHSSRTYLTAGSFLMQSEQKRRAVKFKWGNERAKLHDRLPPIKNESI